MHILRRGISCIVKLGMLRRVRFFELTLRHLDCCDHARIGPPGVSNRIAF